MQICNTSVDNSSDYSSDDSSEDSSDDSSLTSPMEVGGAKRKVLAHYAQRN